jgi:hypothetical protein
MDNETRRLAEFANYRDEDRHECNLLSARVGALLTSQSLLATAAAILYNHDGKGGAQFLVIPVITTMALVMNLFAFLAIGIGCEVMRGWHAHGAALLAADKEDGFLKGRTLNRKQPDWRHALSTDLFNLGMPVCFGTGWFAVVAQAYLGWQRWTLVAALAVLAACWVALLAVVFRLTGKGLSPDA